MSPRPRLATDDEILTGTARAIARLGPAKLRLKDVAAEVGISPAALVQRFGSKRSLLLALASRGTEGNRSVFERLRSRHRSRYARLLAMADSMSELGRTPSEIANSLVFLQIDLTDPDFHRPALLASSRILEEIRSLVREAVRAGELAPCEERRLARVLQATMNGSLLNWAIHREGTLRRWIRRDLETVLRPYRARRHSAKRAT